MGYEYDNTGCSEMKDIPQPQLCHIRPPWNADYKANAAGKKVNFTYYSAFAAE